MVYQTDDAARIRRQRSEQAIKLAMQSRWEDAVVVNLSILELTNQRDGDAFNRLGRALMALGRMKDAREAYGRALQIDPMNQIARKNLATLEKKVETTADGSGGAPRNYVDPKLFVEETGKAALTTLQHPRREPLMRMTAGERVHVRPDGNVLMVYNSAGEAIGQVEPRIGLRLIRLMKGGNEYEAAISQMGQETARIIIKETFQHPSFANRLSFPTAGSSGQPRPYTRDGLVRYDDEDDEAIEEPDTGENWDTDGEPPEQGDVTLLDYQKAQERDADESLFDE
ncbi:MAG: tetratricopeptide repeat protein [Dehalococcoidia bacterium]